MGIRAFCFESSELAGTTTTFVNPAPVAEHVPLNGLKISWSAVEGVAAYVIGIKHRRGDISFVETTFTTEK